MYDYVWFAFLFDYAWLYTPMHAYAGLCIVTNANWMIKYSYGWLYMIIHGHEDHA